MLRVLHTLHDLAEEAPLLTQLEQVRALAGCDSVELYKGLATDETFHVLTSTWEDEASFDAFWAQVLAGDFPEYFRLVEGNAEQTGVTEFYRCERFALKNGAWQPEGVAEKGRTIMWPARGQVRIVIQNAVQASDAMYVKIRQEIIDTRRELGCLSYTWCENVELPGHLLLEEIWADQVLYDQHWALRQHSAEFLGDNLRTPATPQRGPLAREFYRRQAFEHHYNRWQPAQLDGFSGTIVWPAS
ncbi:antibiotic biosynthesis monooxygenase [Luteococcus sp. OSA5]|uniref:antibiotic biosynthesis monooxygenase n=1 Tax=Luteococcus sp. OSA5 TaxID=3401630 RepID=UPI003B4313B1